MPAFAFCSNENHKCYRQCAMLPSSGIWRGVPELSPAKVLQHWSQQWRSTGAAVIYQLSWAWSELFLFQLLHIIAHSLLILAAVYRIGQSLIRCLVIAIVVYRSICTLTLRLTFAGSHASRHHENHQRSLDSVFGSVLPWSRASWNGLSKPNLELHLARPA